MKYRLGIGLATLTLIHLDHLAPPSIISWTLLPDLISDTFVVSLLLVQVD